MLHYLVEFIPEGKLHKLLFGNQNEKFIYIMENTNEVSDREYLKFGKIFKYIFMRNNTNTINNYIDFEIVNPDSSIGKFVKSSHCLFSSGALAHGKIHFMKSLQSEGKLHSSDIDRVPGVFHDYMKEVIEYGDKGELFSDALVLEFAGDSVKNIDELKDLFYRIAFIIAESSPDNFNCITDANPESKDWFFSYGGEEIFFFVFAPFYGSNHSRSTNGINSVFIVIQPDRSFSFHLNKVGGREKFNEIRMRIRENFQKVCQDYTNLEHNKNDGYSPEYINIIKSPFQSYRNIKPLHNGDNVVKWWKQ